MSTSDQENRTLILAIDPGVTTGWIVANVLSYPKEEIEYLVLGEIRCPTPKEDPEWYNRLTVEASKMVASVQEVLRPNEPLLVLMEDFPHTGRLRPESIVQVAIASTILNTLEHVFPHKKTAIKFVQPSARATQGVVFPWSDPGLDHAKDAWRHVVGWVRK